MVSRGRSRKSDVSVVAWTEEEGGEAERRRVSVCLVWRWLAVWQAVVVRLNRETHAYTHVQTVRHLRIDSERDEDEEM